MAKFSSGRQIDIERALDDVALDKFKARQNLCRSILFINIIIFCCFRALAYAWHIQMKCDQLLSRVCMQKYLTLTLSFIPHLLNNNN